MKSSLKTIIKLSTSLFSGILLYVIFPPYDLSFLAWIALFPVLSSLLFARYLEAFLMGFLMGIAFWALHIQWLNVVPALPIVTFLIIVFYCAIYFGFFGLFFTLVVRRTKWPRIFVGPVLWVAIEYIRSNISFLSIPWGLIGHSQHNNIDIIQIASFTSVYGVSFLIVLVNTAIAEGFRWILNLKRGIPMQQPSSRLVLFSISGSLITVLIVYLWGAYQVKTVGSNNTKSILTASLIQGNIPQDVKWDGKFRKQILARYSDLTLKASERNPDIIIWPESATPGYLRNDPLVYFMIRDLVKKTGIPLLLGSSSQTKIGGERKMFRSLNSAFLIDKSGRIAATYNKIRLLPFGEYLPLEGSFPWPHWLVPKNGDFMPGAFPTVFEIPKGKFGVVICWENLFPDLFRKFVFRGSQFMLNLTNEAWFGKTDASSQILSMSIFRAVENRVSLLRCANTGITGIIDPLGRIQGRVIDDNGNDIMVTGILTVSVPESSAPTFYTRNGDVFAIASSIVAFFSILSAMLPLRLCRLLKVPRTS